MHAIPKHHRAAELEPRPLHIGEGVQIERALNKTLRPVYDCHPLRGMPSARAERLARLRALAIQRGEYKQAKP